MIERRYVLLIKGELEPLVLVAEGHKVENGVFVLSRAGWEVGRIIEANVEWWIEDPGDPVVSKLGSTRLEGRRPATLDA